MTIHLVYPYGPRKAAPWSIGNHLAAGLREAGHRVVQYDWEEELRIFPEPGDVLIGHPHPVPGRVFLASLDGSWSRRVALAPWGGAPRVTAWVNGWVQSVDVYCAICGPYWARQLPWLNAVAVDLAIDLGDYPEWELPRRRAPGQRRAVYVGCTLPGKGTAWLEEVVALTPAVRWGHMGPGAVRGCHEHGYVPIESVEAHCIMDEYDLLVAPGDYDANPTVVLEAIAWGLTPLARRTCGWDNNVVDHLPDDPVDAARKIHTINATPSLQPYRRISREQMGRLYSWPKFVARVMTAAGLTTAPWPSP